MSLCARSHQGLPHHSEDVVDDTRVISSVSWLYFQHSSQIQRYNKLYFISTDSTVMTLEK
ncbi:rCG27717 [Rattus norvegicus]|uniref:RCG27717 n=1 Tax=Rattus norvegicus TaxID=10116 RepID=A6KBL4_RAT|nr:rCG27717 [Rattus norvegicus]